MAVRALRRIQSRCRSSPMRNDRHPSMNRLEYTPVPRWRHTSTTLEQTPEERGVLVPCGEADLVNWLVRRFQRALGLFDTKVLHVVNEGEARGEFTNGEPPVLMGDNEGANPVEFLLHALAGCVTTTTVLHAAARGIEIESLSTTLVGDIDLQGLLASATSTPGTGHPHRDGHQGEERERRRSGRSAAVCAGALAGMQHGVSTRAGSCRASGPTPRRCSTRWRCRELPNWRRSRVMHASEWYGSPDRSRSADTQRLRVGPRKEASYD